MRLCLSVLLMMWTSGNFLGVFAQETPRSGFAIVTLVSGNVAGLVATETLKNTISGELEQTVVAPSALITSASLLVPVGPLSESTTAIAIANPSLGSGAVNLVLNDTFGRIVLDTTVRLGPREQFSRYLNEFFAKEPIAFSTPLLLTVSSEIPVAILAFNSRASDFAIIPLTSLSTPTPVPVQPLQTVSTFNALATPTIGGANSLLFTQVVSGGDWSADIAIGNTSALTQVVRIDFFSSAGLITRSLTDIAIQPRGVFFFSTSIAGGVF
jgi:hypothetical protein